MKKIVLLIGILLMLVSASFISSATSITKEENKNENKTPSTGSYSKYYFGPVDVSTSPDFLTTTTFIKKSLIIKNTATTVFAWEIVSGKMYLDTLQGSVELGLGCSFMTKSATLSYSGVEQTENLPTIMKLFSMYFRVTIIDLIELNGQAWGVKVRSPEPI